MKEGSVDSRHDSGEGCQSASVNLASVNSARRTLSFAAATSFLRARPMQPQVAATHPWLAPDVSSALLDNGDTSDRQERLEKTTTCHYKHSLEGKIRYTLPFNALEFTPDIDFH